MSNPGCTPEYNQRTRDMMAELEKIKAQHAEVVRNANRARDLEKQAAGMSATGPVSRVPGRQPHEYTDPRVLDALMKRNMARNQFENFLAKGDRMGRNPFQKVLGIVHDVQMASILASLHVFKKLAYAVGGGHTLSLLADAARSAAKAVIPGVKGIAAEAPRYGEGLSWGAMKARWKGITEASKEAINQIRYGQATREAAFGNPSRMSDEFMTHVGTMSEALHTPGLLNKVAETTRQAASYIGRTHAAEKEFLAQPEFRESLYRRSVAMARELKRQGMTAEQAAEVLSRESTQAGLGAQAMTDAYESKMQGKNKLSSAVDAAIGTLDRSKNAGDNFLGFVAKTLFPIRKIGVNVAIQGSSLMAGAVKALAAAMKGTEGLSKADRAARADYIMKNIGQQGAGAALLTAGILYYDKFGGVPGVFTKKQAPPQKDADGNPIPAGESSFSGSEAFHGAPFAMMQIGASMAQVFKKEQGKDGVTRALDVVLKPTGNWFVRTVPYLDTPRRWINTAEYGRGRTQGLTGAVSQIAGDTLRGMVVPGVVQQKARDDDPYKGFRKPRNLKEDIETGIPGLRETVPIR